MKKLVEFTFGMDSGPAWCPHVVQVTLATDRMGV